MIVLPRRSPSVTLVLRYACYLAFDGVSSHTNIIDNLNQLADNQKLDSYYIPNEIRKYFGEQKLFMITTFNEKSSPEKLHCLVYNIETEKDGIELMDEIEIAFHPDWQYLIVQDLETWGSGNQYILATHSVELCRAVTPKHVKDLPVFKTKIEQYGH
jgi:predicted ATPase